MDIYNKYFNIRSLNQYEKYISEICFINSVNPIISKDLFYIESDRIDKNFYVDDSSHYLRDLFKTIRFVDGEDRTNLILKNSKGFINEIRYNRRYYTYIKVIKDEKNPQFDGKIMIFQFGNRVMNIIDNYHLSCNGNLFNNTLKLIISTTHNYLNYDSSYFTHNILNITDNNLNLNFEKNLNFKTLNILAIDRKEKLQKIINLSV